MSAKFSPLKIFLDLACKTTAPQINLKRGFQYMTYYAEFLAHEKCACSHTHNYYFLECNIM
jgi:hypothetical protein